MKREQWLMKSIVGPLYLVASEAALLGIHWRQESVPMVKTLSGVLARTVRELEEYFTGKRREFTVPLEVEGTEFQTKVWNELKKIPYGATCSYSDIARRVESNRAVRAVGTANGRNPVSIIVPCHRVIAADGSLGGYGGGVDIKTKLLAIERPR